MHSNQNCNGFFSSFFTHTVRWLVLCKLIWLCLTATFYLCIRSPESETCVCMWNNHDKCPNGVCILQFAHKPLHNSHGIMDACPQNAFHIQYIYSFMIGNILTFNLWFVCLDKYYENNGKPLACLHSSQLKAFGQSDQTFLSPSHRKWCLRWFAMISTIAMLLPLMTK